MYTVYPRVTNLLWVNLRRFWSTHFCLHESETLMKTLCFSTIWTILNSWNLKWSDINPGLDSYNIHTTCPAYPSVRGSVYSIWCQALTGGIWPALSISICAEHHLRQVGGLLFLSLTEWRKYSVRIWQLSALERWKENWLKLSTQHRFEPFPSRCNPSNKPYNHLTKLFG